jgi:hypothetical protein
MTLTRSLEPATAIRRIETDRDDLLAIDVSGEVTPSDIENFYGLLEGAYALHDRIDVLVRATEFETADWDGVSRQTMREGRERAEQRVGRCAAVGGPDWTSKLGGFFTEDVPVDVRYFEAQEEDQAWQWLGARPKSV